MFKKNVKFENVTKRLQENAECLQKDIYENIKNLENQIGTLPKIKTGALTKSYGSIYEEFRPTSAAERILAIEKYLGVEYQGTAGYVKAPTKKAKKS